MPEFNRDCDVDATACRSVSGLCAWLWPRGCCTCFRFSRHTCIGSCICRCSVGWIFVGWLVACVDGLLLQSGKVCVCACVHAFACVSMFSVFRSFCVSACMCICVPGWMGRLCVQVCRPAVGTLMSVVMRCCVAVRLYVCQSACMVGWMSVCMSVCMSGLLSDSKMTSQKYSKITAQIQ